MPHMRTSLSAMRTHLLNLADSSRISARCYVYCVRFDMLPLVPTTRRQQMARSNWKNVVCLVSILFAVGRCDRELRNVMPQCDTDTSAHARSIVQVFKQVAQDPTEH